MLGALAFPLEEAHPVLWTVASSSVTFAPEPSTASEHP